MELEPEMSSSSYSENYEPRLSASTTACITGNSKRSRFTPQQRTILNSYYLMGMVGTGKVHSFRIERAARKVECSLDKIKVYFTVCPSDAMHKIHRVLIIAVIFWFYYRGGLKKGIAA